MVKYQNNGQRVRKEGIARVRERDRKLIFQYNNVDTKNPALGVSYREIRVASADTFKFLIQLSLSLSFSALKSTG